MSRLISFYGTQLRVLWEWRGGPVALVKRLLITLVVAAVSFLLTAWIIPRLTVDRVIDAVIAVILMALFNALVRPVILALAAPISLILVAVLVLVLQVVAFLVVAQFAPGVHVDGFGTALIASFVYAIINTVLTAILGIDSGDSYYGLLVQRLLVKRSTGQSDSPGLVILQIDGLAHPILAATHAGRLREQPCQLGPQRDPQAVALGGDPAVDDVGQPGRHPPRQQRRHPGIPLVRARSQAPDGVEQPDRRDADPVQDLEWRGPALEQRREHLQPHDRRRHAVLPDDRLDQGGGRRDRREQGVPRLLLQPIRLPALVHAVPRRVHQGADPGAPNPSFRDPAPDAPRGEVRRHAGGQQRHPARRQCRPDHRRDVSRDERHLRRLHRLRRARPPLRTGACRVVPGARRCR